MENIENDFEGVFYFTNATSKDFSHLWNNVEYTFPKGTTSPMIIRNETLEAIQEIRKRFAYDLAVREFYDSKQYKTMSKMGNGLPPTFDDKILEPWIEQCLQPLPKVKAKITERPKDSDRKFKVTKAVTEKSNLAYEFKDDEPEIKGKQPETAI